MKKLTLWVPLVLAALFLSCGGPNDPGDYQYPGEKGKLTLVSVPSGSGVLTAYITPVPIDHGLTAIPTVYSAVGALTSAPTGTVEVPLYTYPDANDFTGTNTYSIMVYYGLKWLYVNNVSFTNGKATVWWGSLVDSMSVKLSGTADVKIDGERPYSASIYAYDNPSLNGSSLANASISGYDETGFAAWSMVLPPATLSGAATLYFEVRIIPNKGSQTSFYDSGQSVSIDYLTAVTGGLVMVDPITLDEEMLTLSGRVDALWNGQSPTSGVDIRVFTNPEFNNYWYGPFEVNPETGDYIIKIQPLTEPQTLYFQIFFNESSITKNSSVSVAATPSDRDIPVPDITSHITTFAISGTVQVTAEGQPPNLVQITAKLSPDNGGPSSGSGFFTQSDNGTTYWTLTVETFTEPVTLYFQVGARITGTNDWLYKWTGKTLTVNPEDTEKNINLGTFALVRTGTEGITPDDIYSRDKALSLRLWENNGTNLRLINDNSYSNPISQVQCSVGGVEVPATINGYYIDISYGTLSLSPGIHYLTVFALDSYNVWVSKEFNFTVSE
jgi:hypothetical protein